MWLELALASTLGAAQVDAADAEERLSIARIELVGPLRALELSVGNARSSWRGALSPGERFELELAIAAERPWLWGAPVVTWDGAGTARVRGWDVSVIETRQREWRESPPELRARPPALAPFERRPRAPIAGVALALAAALCVIAARARAWLATAVALVGAAAAGWLTAGASTERATRVIEVDGASGAAVAVDGALDQLSGARLDDLRWEFPPRAAALIRSTRGANEFSLHTRGGWVRRWRAWNPEGRSLGPDVNDWGLLAPVWRRDADGQWRELEAWPRGVVLNAEAGKPGAQPPGWLNPALPAGAYVVVGRWVDSPEAAEGQDTWVRWVGR